MTDKQSGMLLSHQAAILGLLLMPQNREFADLLTECFLDEDFLESTFGEAGSDQRQGFVAIFETMQKRLEATPKSTS